MTARHAVKYCRVLLWWFNLYLNQILCATVIESNTYIHSIYICCIYVNVGQKMQVQQASLNSASKEYSGLVTTDESIFFFI